MRKDQPEEVNVRLFSQLWMKICELNHAGIPMVAWCLLLILMASFGLQVNVLLMTFHYAFIIFTFCLFFTFFPRNKIIKNMYSAFVGHKKIKFIFLAFITTTNVPSNYNSFLSGSQPPFPCIVITSILLLAFNICLALFS